jgi:transposase
MIKRRYALRDDQWERIKDLLPRRDGYVGVTAKDRRLFIEAVLHRYRAGSAWRDLPARFRDFRVVHTRFSRWAKTGIWKRVFQHLAADADNEYATIDATIVRAHQLFAGAKKANALPRSGDPTGAHPLIENFFAKLKQYRAIATRYNKRAINFLGAIYLAASVIWLN